MTTMEFRRPLSSFESNMAISGITQGIVLRGSGELREEVLRQALAALKSSYPILGAKAVFSGQGVELAVAPEWAPLFQYSEGDVDAPLSEAERLLPEGEALSVRVVAEKNRFRLAFICNHAFADGRLMMQYVFELFENYTALVRGEVSEGKRLDFPQSPESLLAERDFTSISIEEYVRESYSKDIADLLMAPRQKSTKAEIGAQPDTLPYALFEGRVQLDRVQTSALKELAKRRGATVHALVAAATVIAEFLLSEGEREKLVVLRSAVDARSRLSPPVVEVAEATNCAGSTAAVFFARRDEDPLLWAERVRDQLTSDLEGGLLPHSMVLLGELIKVLIEAGPVEQGEDFGLARVFITNIGIMPNLHTPDGVAIDDMRCMVHRTVVPKKGATDERAYVVLTFNGRLGVDVAMFGQDRGMVDEVKVALSKAFDILLAGETLSEPFDEHDSLTNPSRYSGDEKANGAQLREYI